MSGALRSVGVAFPDAGNRRSADWTLETAFDAAQWDVAWLRRDLIRRVEGLGLPVTAIVPGRRKLTVEEMAEDMGRVNVLG